MAWRAITEVGYVISGSVLSVAVVVVVVVHNTQITMVVRTSVVSPAADSSVQTRGIILGLQKKQRCGMCTVGGNESWGYVVAA
jgi:hypothetical protein